MADPVKPLYSVIGHKGDQATKLSVAPIPLADARKLFNESLKRHGEFDVIELAGPEKESLRKTTVKPELPATPEPQQSQPATEKP